jgi:hypothetical protein
MSSLSKLMLPSALPNAVDVDVDTFALDIELRGVNTSAVDVEWSECSSTRRRQHTTWEEEELTVAILAMAERGRGVLDFLWFGKDTRVPDLAGKRSNPNL